MSNEKDIDCGPPRQFYVEIMMGLQVQRVTFQGIDDARDCALIVSRAMDVRSVIVRQDRQGKGPIVAVVVSGAEVATAGVAADD